MFRQRWNPTGKLAIVTGATSGIGRELTKQLVVSGAYVLAVGRREDRLNALRASMDPFQDRLLVASGDVTDAAFRCQLIAQANDRPEPFALLVNAAGVGALGGFQDATEIRLRRVFEVNFFGAVELSRLALPLLLKHSDSVLCNIGSVLGHVAVPFKSEYVASKFALLGWSNSLRAELAGTNVHVTVISPSTTATEFFDVAMDARPGESWNRFGAMTAEDVASIAMKAIVHRKREVILSTGGKFLVWLNRLCPPGYAKIIARLGTKKMSRDSTDKPIRLTCPTCGQSFLMHQSNAMPFCSKRCSLVDLGRWINEEIGLPYEGNPGDAPDSSDDEF